MFFYILFPLSLNPLSWIEMLSGVDLVIAGLLFLFCVVAFLHESDQAKLWKSLSEKETNKEIVNRNIELWETSKKAAFKSLLYLGSVVVFGGIVTLVIIIAREVVALLKKD